MADENIAKRAGQLAQQLLKTRLEPVEALGALLDQKSRKEKELADLAEGIEKAYTQCLEAGWKADELAQLGLGRPGKRRAKPAAAPAGPPAGGQPTHQGQ
jgi:hypothetical protein